MEATIIQKSIVPPIEGGQDPQLISALEGAAEKTTTTPPVYTLKDVASHINADDLWLVIDNEVYDVTKFRHEHPGGAKILSGVAGKDATKKFDKYHRRALLDKYKPSLRIGVVDYSEAMTTSRRRFLKKLGIGKNQT